MRFRYHPSNVGQAPGYGSYPYVLRVSLGDISNAIGGNYAPWDAWYGMRDYEMQFTLPEAANRIRFEVTGGVPNAILDDISIEYVPETIYWVWGLDLSGALQGAGGVGGLLTAITPGGVCYPFCDGNGNITDWIGQDGEIIAHHEYDPYGNEITDNPPSAYGFSSKPLDPTLSLYYYGYRFYRPDWGRWINRDPIEELGGIGLYTTVNNNMICGVDILGLNIFQSIKNAYDKIKGAIALCKSLPIFVDSPVIECTSIEGAYRHCWNNCVALRCGAWSGAAIAYLGIYGTFSELINWHEDSLSDLLMNLQGLSNSFKIDSCASSCTKSAQDQADAKCCASKPYLDKNNPKCCP